MLLIKLIFESLFEFGFIHLILDLFFRFSFACHSLLLCLFFLLVLVAYSTEFVI